MIFIKNGASVYKTRSCGNRLKAERKLFWLVHNSFQIRIWLINHFFGFSIIVLRNHMMQVTSDTSHIVWTGLNKNKQGTNSKPQRQNNTSLSVHWNLSLTDISRTWLAVREYRVGFPCFLLVWIRHFRDFFSKITVWKSLTFYISPTTNVKSISYLDRIWSYPPIY